MKVHSEYCDARVGGAVCENYCKGKAGEHGGLLIKGITGSNLLLQEDCEFGRGGCSPVQILLTQGAVQAD